MEKLTWIEILFAVLATGYLISGIDDIIIDLLYWVRRLFKGAPFKPVRVSELLDVPEQRAAIFIPAWREEAVLEEMLLFNARVIQYENYDIFVGTYPNDEATQACVDAAACVLPNIIKCVGPQPGPTTKADNLNAMLAEMEQREQLLGVRYDFMVLHDAEDILHPFELKLLNYHLARGTGAMIQLPIYPVRTPLRRVTAATYMDQFAEMHTKDMHVRGWVGGFVPSSGVATAFSRAALDALREVGDGITFNPTQLTEDYDIGLKLSFAGQQAVFVRQQLILDVPPEAFTVPEERPIEAWVATRSEFPETFERAMRQRSRWMLGIVYQSWKHNGWRGSFVNKWLLFHDRKAPWSYLLVALGYWFLVVLSVHTLLRMTLRPDLPPLLPDKEWINVLLLATTVLMVNRLGQRGLAVWRVYDLPHAVLAILRQPWDNLINMASVTRATHQFATSEIRGKRLQWEKTQHTVPATFQGSPALDETTPKPVIAPPDAVEEGDGKAWSGRDRTHTLS